MTHSKYFFSTCDLPTKSKIKKGKELPRDWRKGLVFTGLNLYNQGKAFTVLWNGPIWHLVSRVVSIPSVSRRSSQSPSSPSWKLATDERYCYEHDNLEFGFNIWFTAFTHSLLSTLSQFAGTENLYQTLNSSWFSPSAFNTGTQNSTQNSRNCRLTPTASSPKKCKVGGSVL